MSGRTTLKTYFLTGSSPTEANFADLIDSVLVLSEDITGSLASTSDTLALSASAGKALNDSITGLDSRVTTLEGADNNFASNYYTKSEVDTNISAVSNQFNTLPYASQISAIDGRVSTLESSTSGYANSVHAHTISDVTGLQGELDLKATITFVREVESSLVSIINNLEVGDESAEVALLQSQVAVINTTISSLPTASDLNTKADATHTHVVADISDINSAYYNKSQTDALLSNVQPSAHTHTESEITDLDKYTKAQTDLKLTDHNNLTNNPHNVTKAQVSLGNVENLSVADLFATPQAQAFATDAELQAASLSSNTHISSTNNPHNVTKAQVSLGNVPNINFQSLLDAHLNASNPHNINLTYFDVYSRAETDTRVVHYIDTLRYAFKPTTPTDGAGAVGDIAYDNTGLYFKFGSTDWRQVLASKSFNDGSASSKFEVEAPKFEVTTPGGVNLFKVDNTTNTTNINTANVSIGGTTNISGQVSLGSGLTAQGAVSINNTLNVSAHSVLSTLRATDVVSDSLGTGAITCSSLNATNDVSVAGNLTVSGTTTSIDTTNLLIEDNMVVLNKNQTGTPSSVLDSGIEVERGTETNAKIFWDEATDKWKCDLGGNVKTITFDEDAPATYPPSLHTHAWSEITSVPSTFAPSSHTHPWSQITSIPTTFTPSSHTHPWSEITSVPTTFTPSSHSHAWSEITSKPTTFTPSSHGHAWSEITSKPTTFAPSSHTHSASQITDFTSSVNTLISSSSGSSPTTTTTNLTSGIISPPSAWGSNQPSARFSYTLSGNMVTVQWYLSGANNSTPLSALNGDSIYYVLGGPTSAVAFDKKNSDHIIKVPISVNDFTGQNISATGLANVNVHLDNNTRIGLSFWGIPNSTTGNLWEVSGQLTYPT